MIIMDTLKDYEQNSVNIVIENLQPLVKTNFPSLGVCELGNLKDEDSKVYDIVERFLFNYIIL